MKALKIIGVILLVLVAVFVVAMFMLPSEMVMARSVTIDAPKEVVYNNIKSMKMQHEWSPWRDFDSNMQVTYEGNEAEPGDKMSWKGNEDVGAGNQEIVKVTDTRIDTRINFIEPWESTAESYVELEEISENETQATWGFKSDVGRFMAVLGPLMGMKESIAKDFDKGLAKLKARSEADAVALEQQKSSQTVYEITVQEMPEQTYLGVRKEIGHDEMKAFYEQNLGKIYGEVQKENLEIAGAPSGIYYFWDEQNKRADMAAAIPVKSAERDLSDIKVIKIPAGKRIILDYYGPYEGLGNAHLAIEDYMEKNNISHNNAIAIEEYITDPSEEPDTALWQTRIYYVMGE